MPEALRRLVTQKMMLLGALLCLGVLVMALGADWLSAHSPVRTRMRNAFQAPSDQFLLGTDHLGRDVLARVMHGARLSLLIGLSTVGVTALAGTLVGLAAGFFRRFDDVLMRLMDAMMAFPAILLAVAITAALGPSGINAVIALAAVYVPRTARIVRASVLVVREMDHVVAARALGASDIRIMLVHILPYCLPPLVVQLTFVFAYAVLAEAALSFLGMGPPPPAPTWGNVIADGRDYLREAPWICLFPGIAISLTVLGLNLLGDGLRDLLDPRLKIQQG
ncbi:MAG: ABC transporter permease [Alphaproteobacteria bacterium]|nr:ABC transporter permease [Alphaproteobacteria bacterium]